MEISYSRNDKIVRKKFYQYLIPAVLMVLAMQFGSLADAIVVGNFLGDNALSATSLALPIIYLVELPGFALAVGGSIVAANFIGKRKTAEASKIFKVIFLLSILVSMIFIPFGLLLSGPAATWLSGNFGELQPMMAQYILVYSLQAPILGVGLVVAYFLPADNHPVLGAMFFLVGNAVHIGAEILFVRFLGPDVAMLGVASSMGIGMLAGLVVLIPYIRSKKRTIDLKTPIKGGFALLGKILKAGSGTAALIGMSFVSTIVLNIAASSFLQPAEMPVFAMLSNVCFVIDLFIVGAIQVMPSIVPVLFGEKDYFGVKAVTKRVLLLTLAVTAFLIAVTLAFPQLFFYIFGIDYNQAAQQFATLTYRPTSDPLFVVRIYAIMLLFYALNKFLINYYPSIMVNSPAVFSNVARVGVIGPIVTFFLTQALGVMGYTIGVIILEAASLGLTIVFILISKKVHRLSGQGLLLLPKEEVNSKHLDISLPAKREEITKAIAELQGFAEDASGNKIAAGMLAVACEEIIANIVAYGYSRKQREPFIDISLTKTDEKMLVRIRDDGTAFDPTAYEPGEEEEMSYHGIEVVRKIATTFTYLRILNTNNTIMEISIAK